MARISRNNSHETQNRLFAVYGAFVTRGGRSYYEKASAELDSALKIAPDNFDARKLRITILLGQNRFEAALKAATDLNHKIPDDIALWGVLAEINTALGNYEEAVRDAQWVLNIRPGSLLGFSEAARLRAAYGDAEGAIEFYEEARRRTALGDAEERSWLLVQIAGLTAQSGDLKRADTLLGQAMALNPESQLAIAGRGKLRMMQGNYSEAVSLFHKRYDSGHIARSLYDLAGALEKAGQSDEAAAAFGNFEVKALAETEHPHNANIELIEYYLERKSKPAEALAIAKRESAVRHDSQTMASLAWAECHVEQADKACKLELSAPTFEEAKK
jgi:tetratricopeptide (TPR) repeat protein